MNPDTHESLRTRLLLRHPDSTPEEYEDFYRELIKHRFARLLSLYDKNEEVTLSYTNPVTLPAEHEIQILLHSAHPELFLKNILYHLHRNKKVVPPGTLPTLLTQFKNHPEAWESIYNQHPELAIALSQEHGEWNYITRVFDGEISLQIGSPGYYDALQVRMQVLPLRTSTYILKIYSDASPVQQARLLDILHEDPSPENRQFIASQVNHSRKPVRLAALRSCILRKEDRIYDSIKNSLLKNLKNPDNEPAEDFSDGQVYWKDLTNLADETTQIKTLVSFTDPDDYLEKQSDSFRSEYRSSLLKAAIFHRSQETLYYSASDAPSLLIDPAMTAAIDSTTAIKILKSLTAGPTSSFDQIYLDLLKRIHPFLDEADSDLVWKKFVQQWAEMPFTLEELPLEVLALRIHPNRIKPVWQHPLLQETAAPLHKIREILKNRLEFLKKCYGS